LITLNNSDFKLILLLLFSFLVSLVTSRIGIWLAQKFNIIDYPGRTGHNIHSQPTPRAGGMAIILALFLLTVIFKLWTFSAILAISLSMLIIFIFGLWDDRYGMNAPTKLLGQIMAVSLLITGGIRVQFFENPQFFISINQSAGLFIDIFITYFWMIAITNAFNLIDSMDGLALGLSMISILFFLIFALQSEQEILLFMSLIFLGVSFGLYLFNRYPAKTFLGDSGAQTLGFILSAIAIYFSPKAFSQSSTWFVPIILFGVPIFDTSLVTISRTLNRLPFYKAQLDHTYHRLVRLGWKNQTAVSTMHLAAILNGIMAFACIYLEPVTSNLLFAVWLLLFFYLLLFLLKRFSYEK